MFLIALIKREAFLIIIIIIAALKDHSSFSYSIINFEEGLHFINSSINLKVVVIIIIIIALINSTMEDLEIVIPSID